MKVPTVALDSDRVRILYVITSSLSLRLLRGQLSYLQRAGFEVTVACSPDEEIAEEGIHEGVRRISVPMAREISLRQDLLSVWAMWKVMRQLRPTIVNASTPKGGFLGGLVAWACRVPCRIYTLRGMRCEVTAVPKRLGLMLCEYIACLFPHRVICVSYSLRQKAVATGLVEPQKAIVLGSGSSNGVDESHFAPSPVRSRQATQLRQRLGIPPEAPVVGFVGRLTLDKGVDELVRAYSSLRQRFPTLRLLLVGDFERGDPLPGAIRRYIESDRQIIKPGFVRDPSLHYHVMDVLALPSHREGFPNVVLEANAAGKPVVAARATGVVDAVIDGVTGILVPVGDSKALGAALGLLLEDRSLAVGLGATGRERVLREFPQDRIWEAIVEEYLQLLRTKGFSVPTRATRNRATLAIP